MSSAAAAKKDEGNRHFKAKNFDKAIDSYTEAIEMDPSNHVLFSNRSASHLSLGHFVEAKADAKQCIDLNKDFVKGYFRLASAQSKNKEYNEAVKTCKAGQRVDFNNADLSRLLADSEAEASRAEAKARRGMDPAEKLKAEGNDLFKSAAFEAAIEKYTQCLNRLTDKTSALAITCYNNRAACYQQLSNFHGTIEDASAVLEADPNNLKALLRRGLAFEAVERYRFALEDIRKVLQIDPSVVIANKAQHRLGQTVRRLKEQSKGDN